MYQYLEVNFIGIILLLIMYLYMHKCRAYEEKREQKYFQTMLAVNALILFFDNCIYILRGHSAKPFIIINHAVCCSYFILHIWFCYYWIKYVIARLYPRHKQTLNEKILLALPAVLHTLFVLTSPSTGFVYSLSSDNRYHRGPFMWVTIAVAFLYCIINSLIIVFQIKHPSMSRKFGTYMTLLLFPAPAIIGNILQLRFYGLSITWICMAITLLILFVDLQTELLSRDELTGLFNRRQMNTQLAWEVEHLRHSTDFLFVAMIDIDSFKRINDRFGHLIGDDALAAVSSILKRSSRKNDFISRFGGDEFLLTGHIKDEADVFIVVQRIKESVTEMNSTGRLPCTLSLSIGTAVFSKSSNVSMDSILDEADKHMYEIKKTNQ